MAESDGRHVCGPFPDPTTTMGFTCPGCGLGYMYVRDFGWKTDSLFAGDPAGDLAPAPSEDRSVRERIPSTSVRSLVEGQTHQRWVHLGDLLADMPIQPDPTGTLASYVTNLEAEIVEGDRLRSMVDVEHQQRWIHLGDLLNDLRTRHDLSGVLAVYAEALERWALRLDSEVDLSKLG